MKITHVEARAYRIPPSVPWEDATNIVDALEFVIVNIQTDCGLIGTGLSYSVDIGCTAIKALIEDYLAPLIIGSNPLHYEAIWQRLQRQSRRLGLGVNSLAIAAIDIAVWDLIGKYYKQPLYKLLGGARHQIPAYISEINLNSSLEELLARVDEYKAQGYKTMKIKIGKDCLEEDIERIIKVQERLGKSGTLLIDLNQKWTAAQAMQFGARLDALNLGWIEEPLLYHDIQGHSQLKKAITTPIALGESLFSKHQFLEYLKADAVDIVQADVAFVGGITEWLKIAHLADAFHRPVAPHFMIELSLHLLCGVPNGYMLENVVGGSLTELGILETPIVIKDGMGTPSELHGHGIVFDEAALDRYTLDPQQLRSTFTGGSK
jgi:L-alanine-DL-glutamate epimerase-like enolase superfamily enzyme